MGLFDTIHCEYPLPDARHQNLEFQTKDLECFLGHYTITCDGRLLRHARRVGGGPQHNVECPLHGDISIYTQDRATDTWIEYVVRFTHGRVEGIRPPSPAAPLEEESLLDPFWEELEAEPDLSALPDASPADPGETAVLDPEEALLRSLRCNRRELEKLLREYSGHWGYEDPVYRFYHQSFKVYELQQQTQTIRDRLQALAPDRPLNPWFVQIIREGTGKEFKPEDNARWTEVTRPILEAFFHARFFLEMAVRSADLLAPPPSLSSGYAALLYLFGLR